MNTTPADHRRIILLRCALMDASEALLRIRQARATTPERIAEMAIQAREAIQKALDEAGSSL